MRIHHWASIFVLIATCSSMCGEPPAQRTYPLWDGVESVADYAKRVNLPPTKTLDLGNSVKLDLVLIPAGKFIMGTPEPTPVDEAAFRKSIFIGQVLLGLSASALLIMLGVVLARAIRQKRRPQVSLLLLTMMAIAAGGCVLGGMHSWHSFVAFRNAKEESLVAEAGYKIAKLRQTQARPVTFSKPFYMGKYLVTQDQYQQLLGTNPSQFKNDKDNPVETVSWNEAQEFCMRLEDRAKQRIRLPSESEWEYGCRAGTTIAYYTGDAENEWARSNGNTYSVGHNAPNTFGLFDMHGIVMQWCGDRLDEENLFNAEAENPKGQAQGSFRISRAGSSRYWLDPSNRSHDVGFRIVMLP